MNQETKRDETDKKPKSCFFGKIKKQRNKFLANLVIKKNNKATQTITFILSFKDLITDLKIQKSFTKTINVGALMNMKVSAKYTIPASAKLPTDPPHPPPARGTLLPPPKLRSSLQQGRSLRARPLAYTCSLAELFDLFLHLKMQKVQVTLQPEGTMTVLFKYC